MVSESVAVRGGLSDSVPQFLIPIKHVFISFDRGRSYLGDLQKVNASAEDWAASCIK